jgi:hypothetical protein
MFSLRAMLRIGTWKWLSFYDQLYSIRIRHGEVDRVVWNFSKRSFEVKTFYKALVCHEAASFS